MWVAGGGAAALTGTGSAASGRKLWDNITGAPWRWSGIVLVVAAILLPALLFGFSAWTGYRDTLRTAELRADRTARVLEEHVSKVFESHRLVIQQVRDRLRFVDWGKEEDRIDLHKLLQDLQDELDQVSTITIVDADGRMQASGRIYPADRGVSFADRDWFQTLRSGVPGAAISRSYVGRQSGQPVFNIAVALRDKTGAFAGAIVVSVDRSYFETFYKEVEPDFDHAVTLTRSDGEILARTPPTTITHLPTPSRLLSEASRAPFGHYIGASVIDGTNRIFAYRKVGTYPVYVRFSLATDAVLAQWRRSLLDYGIVSMVSALALAVASWLVVRQSFRERLARDRWQETAAALEAEIAERERVDAQLRQLQKMEAIGRLTGGIAHDFNNLLTAILGNLELAGRRIEDPRVARLVGNAVDGAQRAATLTGRLLAFSRQQPLQPRRVALNDLVDGVGELLRVTLGASIVLRVRPATEVWPVAIDVSQLENAILNLAVNARDAMPEGGTLTIETQNSQVSAGSALAVGGEVEPGDYAVVSVGDTGQGMTAEIMAQVFEPFFTTKPVGKDTGLGLSQVYGFARQSGGHAVIRSEMGRGTTIRLFLPRLIQGEDVAPAEVSPSAPPAARARGETILVVEDEDIVRTFAASALREQGYRVLEAADGPSALILLSAHPEVALLFTDIVLRGPMNGWALAKAATRHRRLPVLYTSGYSRESVVSDDRLHSGAELLPKPFTSETLVTQVRCLLDTSALASPSTMAG